MSRCLCVLAAICCVIAVWRPPARADAIDDDLARIERARARVTTMTARFDQERVMGLFAQTVHAQGRLIVARPDRVRWELLAPTPATFIVNAGRVGYRSATSSGSASQAQIGPLGSVLGDLASFLGGPLRPLRARYRITLTHTASGGLELSASPIDTALARVVDHVVLAFRADLQAVDRIEIHEHGGDRSVIHLRDVTLNTTLPPASFDP